MIGSLGQTNVNDINKDVIEVRSNEELSLLDRASVGSVLLAGSTLRSTPESIENSISVV